MAQTPLAIGEPITYLLSEAIANGDTSFVLTYSDVNGEEVNITYVQSPSGHWRTTNTHYKFTEDRYVINSGDHMTGDLTNAEAFSGGFRMEDRADISDVN